MGIDAMEKQIKLVEDLINYYALPLPNKPPATINTPFTTSPITDEVIYRNIHFGMQTHTKLLIDHFNHAVASILRENFRNMLIIEMDLYDEFTEYGKLKGYLVTPPSFRP